MPSTAVMHILAALPAEYRDVFAQLEAKQDGLCGLYLSSYFSHRLLTLAEDGTYRLLFWSTDPRDFASEPRFYCGAYWVDETEDGDRLIRLEIELRTDSLGSDANDEALYVVNSDGLTWLLRAGALEDIANGIGFNGRMGRQDDHFQRVRLTDVIPEYECDGVVAPPWNDLPRALQALVHVEPLRATIVSIGVVDDETVMVKVDLGTKDGLRMNMPLMSPKGSLRPLFGWVWDLDADSCGVGLELEQDDAGHIVNAPQVGDVLVTRAG